MKPKKQDDARQLKLDFRVKLEPVLQAGVVGLSPEEVAARARAHFRWAKQLYVLHRVMVSDGMSRVPAPLPRVPQCSSPERN